MILQPFRMAVAVATEFGVDLKVYMDVHDV